MSTELASYIAQLLPAGTTLVNNQYLQSRNQAGTANISLLKVDATDDTVLNADIGDVLKLAINNTTEATVNDDSLSFSGATFSFIPGSTSLQFRNAANSANNLSITDAGLVTIRNGLTVTAGGATITAGGLTVTSGNILASSGNLTLAAGDITATSGNVVISDTTKGINQPHGTIAAAGSNQATATAITARRQLVTGSTGTNGVRLPVPTIGDDYLIINTNNLGVKLYPQASAVINGLGLNVAADVNGWVVVTCYAHSTGGWWCSEGIAP
jgi:hypothetical protein